MNRRESNLLHKELWSEKEKENETKVSEANEKELMGSVSAGIERDDGADRKRRLRAADRGAGEVVGVRFV